MGYSAPSGKIYAYSPSVLTLDGYSQGTEIIITVNSTFTFKRYIPASGSLSIPMSRIFKMAYANVEVGNVLAATGGTQLNSASKLVQSITVAVTANGSSVFSTTYYSCYAGLSVGESEPLTETIYRFGTLPLTITCNFGTSLTNSAGTLSSTNGKDYFVLEADTQVLLKTSSTVNKTYNIQNVDHCPDMAYLRWVNKYGNYNYFGFKKISETTEEETGDIFTKDLLSLPASGLYKTQNQIINKRSSKVLRLSNIATYEQQKFLKGLYGRIKVWYHLGENNWCEVFLKALNVEVDEKWQQSKSVDLEISFPNDYNQSL